MNVIIQFNGVIQLYKTDWALAQREAPTMHLLHVEIQGFLAHEYLLAPAARHLLSSRRYPRSTGLATRWCSCCVVVVVGCGCVVIVYLQM